MTDITACLVTRGDQPEMMDRIRESLIFDRVIVWDNSVQPDWKTAGRYMAALLADTDLVYWQDDDVIVPPETQEELVRLFSVDDHIFANWGHGENPDGYDDLPLVCGGAVANRWSAWQAIGRYAAHHSLDVDFRYDADFAVGVLYPSFRWARLPFEINLEVAQHPSRLVNQPWQKDTKLRITERARAIRDKALQPA